MFRRLYVVLAALLALVVLTSGAHAQSGYLIKPGDTLQVEVLEDSSLNRTALVLPDGSINFPLAGTVRAAGRTVNQVSSTLAANIAPNFATTPNIFVSVAVVAPTPVVPFVPREPVTREIYLTGEVSSPGKIEATPGTTVLQAIAQAGGLTPFAASKRIQLRRGTETYLYNFNTNGGGTSIAGNTILAPGDVIVVPQRGLFE